MVFGKLTELYYHHYNSFSEGSHCSQKILMSICDQPYLLPSPQSVSLLYSSINLHFLDIDINGTVQYVVFYDWSLTLSIMRLRFIHIVAYISTLFFLIAK